MNSLPSEIISLIVLYLDSTRDLHACTLLNKTFYQMTNPLLWRTIDFKGNARALKLFAGLVGITAPRKHPGRHVQKISLSNIEWHDFEFPPLSNGASRVDTLQPDKREEEKQFMNTGLQQLAHYCPHLTNLHLKGFPVTHSTIDTIGQHCRQLGQLSLVNCNKLSGNVFAALRACPLDDVTISRPPPILRKKCATKDLVIRCPGLTRLALEDLRDFRYLRRILSTAGWPHLIRLTIRDNIDDYSKGVALAVFLRSHLDLKELVLGQRRTGDCCGSPMVINNLLSIRHPGITHLTLPYHPYICRQKVHQLIQQWPQLLYIGFLSRMAELPKFPECLVTIGDDGDDYQEDCQSKTRCKQYMCYLDQHAINKIRSSSSVSMDQGNS